MITNEDDCSVPAGVPLFDTSANLTLASVLGPPSNFRCNEFGHLCDGAPPSRLAPGGDVTATQAYGNCVSAEGSGHLLTVADTAARIKALKPDPDNQIIVAGISGPETPYGVHWKTPSVNDTGPWPEISHSCTAPDGSFADPSVRTSQLVRQFGANGLLLPICADDFAPALQRIADKIIDRLTKPCIVGTVAKRPGTTSDDCNVVSTSASSSGASRSEHREPRSFLRRHGRGGPVLAVRPRRKRVHRPGCRDGAGCRRAAARLAVHQRAVLAVRGGHARSGPRVPLAPDFVVLVRQLDLRRSRPRPRRSAGAAWPGGCFNLTGSGRRRSA